MRSEEIGVFLFLSDELYLNGLISRKKYKEHLLYLVDLSGGKYLYHLDYGRNNFRVSIELGSDIEPRRDNKYNAEKNFIFVEEVNSSPEDPNKFSLITIKTGNFGKWKLAGISDPDPNPSIPHFHGVDKYSKYKLDPYTGKVYIGKVVVGKEDMDIIRGMWSHEGFRGNAIDAVENFRSKQKEDVYDRYLKKRNLTKERAKVLPRKRNRGSERVF